MKLNSSIIADCLQSVGFVFDSPPLEVRNWSDPIANWDVLNLIFQALESKAAYLFKDSSFKMFRSKAFDRPTILYWSIGSSKVIITYRRRNTLTPKGQPVH